MVAISGTITRCIAVVFKRCCRKYRQEADVVVVVALVVTAAAAAASVESHAKKRAPVVLNRATACQELIQEMEEAERAAFDGAGNLSSFVLASGFFSRATVHQHDTFPLLNWKH